MPDTLLGRITTSAAILGAECPFGLARDTVTITIPMRSELTPEGVSFLTVAAGSNSKVDRALEGYSHERRRETGPLELTTRGSAGAGNRTAKPEQPLSPNAPIAKPPSSTPQLPH